MIAFLELQPTGFSEQENYEFNSQCVGLCCQYSESFALVDYEALCQMPFKSLNKTMHCWATFFKFS